MILSVFNGRKKKTHWKEVEVTELKENLKSQSSERPETRAVLGTEATGMKGHALQEAITGMNLL